MAGALRNDQEANVRRRIEGGVVVLEEALGTIRIEQLPGDVVLSTLRGRHTEALAIAMSSEIEAILMRVKRIHNFYDGWEQDGHDTAIRNHWQEWAKRHRSRLHSNQMLYQPRNAIATMASTVANLLLGGSLQIHTSRTAFQEALRNAKERGSRA
jgi:hypothetical protein